MSRKSCLSAALAVLLAVESAAAQEHGLPDWIAADIAAAGPIVSDSSKAAFSLPILPLDETPPPAAQSLEALSQAARLSELSRQVEATTGTRRQGMSPHLMTSSRFAGAAPTESGVAFDSLAIGVSELYRRLLGWMSDHHYATALLLKATLLVGLKRIS